MNDVPQIESSSKWSRHFEESVGKPMMRKGRFIIVSGTKPEEKKEKELAVSMVSPAEQHVEQAKEMLNPNLNKKKIDILYNDESPVLVSTDNIKRRVMSKKSQKAKSAPKGKKVAGRKRKLDFSDIFVD